MSKKNLARLLQTLQPLLADQIYVYCLLSYNLPFDLTLALSSFRETEGLSLILEQKIADQYNLFYESTFRLISLRCHSSLEAIGLTAAVSTALANADISCNMIAAFSNDHILVPSGTEERAMKVLHDLGQN